MPMSVLLQRLSQRILDAQQGESRVLIALAGPPGAGKSTLSSPLQKQLQQQAGEDSCVIVPMDGFHLDNEELALKGLLSVKGAPQTFDAQAFVQLVAQLRQDNGTLSYPLFDRTLDKTLPNAAKVDSRVRFIIFEGNYLLLRQPPWSELAAYFDVTLMLSVPLPILHERLVKRWLDHNLSPEDAQARAEGNDLVNARVVLEQSVSADLTIACLPNGEMQLQADSA